jgi:hypothetical protein
VRSRRYVLSGADIVVCIDSMGSLSADGTRYLLLGSPRALSISMLHTSSYLVCLELLIPTREMITHAAKREIAGSDPAVPRSD